MQVAYTQLAHNRSPRGALSAASAACTAATARSLPLPLPLPLLLLGLSISLVVLLLLLLLLLLHISLQDYHLIGTEVYSSFWCDSNQAASSVPQVQL
jgi:hypothetical protein